ncbi:MAG: SGNH/GDSL hydrolase family protein [Pseudomonadota bacterium]
MLPDQSRIQRPSFWRNRKTLALLVVATITIAAVLLALHLRRSSYLTTEILVLGDSQLSFGAGPVLSTFFADLPNACRADVARPNDLTLLEGKRFAMIGTRSTSLQSWVQSDGRAWELLCHKDKRWGVNASAWGTVKPAERRYIQVGEGDKFQFCQQPKPPLANLLSDGYYQPQLLMVFVGGNGARRLARSQQAANADVTRFVARLPAHIGCIFMMTAPIYSESHNTTRVVAQANLRAAFATHGRRCAFVDGHTSATRAAIEGQPQFFKRDNEGNVTDPYHADAQAAARFLALRRPALCRALASQFRRRAAAQ